MAAGQAMEIILLMHQKCSLQEKEMYIPGLNERDARAALLGTEGGIELSPGESQRQQQGLPGASVAWDTDRDRDTVIRAHCARQECEQTLPLALQSTAWNCHPGSVWEPHLVQGTPGREGTVTG